MDNKKVKKPKHKSKGPKVRELKKPIIISGMVAAISIAGILSGVYFFFSIETPKPDIEFNYAIYALPDTLDPLEVASEVDTYLVQTIADGLFRVNITADNSEIVYGLATHHEWSTDNLNLTCTLRSNINFHDGTPFNAAAVKWNFDRIYRLIDQITYPDLWKFLNGTFIINQTQIIDEYTVRFVLNAPYSAFESLLSCYSAHIVSPASTPADQFLDIFSDTIYGTGPFIFSRYEYNSNMSLIANPFYWGGKSKIDRLNIILIDEFDALIDAFISGRVHATRSYAGFNETELNIIRGHPSITFEKLKTPNLRWILFNNKKINVTMRKAISYAINYSIIETLGGIRTASPIPNTIRYHNTTGINIPYYNLSIARNTLINANWNGTLGLTANDDISPSNEWELIADSSFPLATYNYTFLTNRPSDHPHNLFLGILTENLKQIGIKINPLGITSAQYWAQIEEIYGYNRDMFDISYSYWLADFNDPSNFINILFSNKESKYNSGQVNDTLTQLWMEQALETTNPALRRNLYYQIQKHLIEDVYPIACSYSTIMTDVYLSNVTGWYSNSFLFPFRTVAFK